MTDTTPVPTHPRSVVGPLAWLRGEIDRMTADLGRPARDFFTTGIGLPFASPCVDMTEQDGHYCLTAELPGLNEKDVNVTVTDHELVISGEKREGSDRQEGSFMLRERRYGSFERHIILPIDAKDEGIDAHFDRGVLTVIVPRGDGKPERGRRIEIRSPS